MALVLGWFQTHVPEQTTRLKEKYVKFQLKFEIQKGKCVLVKSE